jgi:hypothetical protein
LLQSSLISLTISLIGVLKFQEKVVAKAEALAGPMTPPGKRVQTINPPGSEVGPGTAGAVATWGTATADEVDAMGFKWERKGRSSKHIPFDWSGP